MNRDAVIGHIKSLTDKELVDLIYDATKGRDIFSEEAAWSENKLVLCNASRDKDEDGSWSEWRLELLAQEDKNEYPEGWSPEAPICQEGKTLDNMPVFGWAKKMTCPITGKQVYGT
jgi:hypothetical protein